jgi:hypothetical protein
LQHRQCNKRDKQQLFLFFINENILCKDVIFSCKIGNPSGTLLLRAWWKKSGFTKVVNDKEVNTDPIIPANWQIIIKITNLIL